MRVLLTLLALALTAVPAQARRVLVVTETAGFVHPSIEDGLSEMRRAARRSRRIEMTHVPRAGGLTDRRLRGAHAVMFLSTTGELPMPDDRKRALLRFVRRGGGFVGTHSATDTFHTTWPDYLELIGAEFRTHGPITIGRVEILDRRHPATDDLPTAFSIRDEFYEFAQPPDAHVLARLQGGGPLVWCRRHGDGRVFYDALGHEPSTWRDARHRRLLRGGLRWALGLERGRCPRPAR